MDTLIAAKELDPEDLFTLPNGSVYTVVGSAGEGGTPRARLWCAHGADPITFQPALIDLPPDQQVRLLDGKESETHRGHDGYVATGFVREMDRRHAVNMRAVGERRRAIVEAHKLARTARPWWKKLFR